MTREEAEEVCALNCRDGEECQVARRCLLILGDGLRRPSEMASTFWTDGYRDAQVGRQYSPPEHSAASVFTAEYQRGYNAFYDERAIELRPVSPRIAAKLARCEEMARMQKLKTRQVLTDCMWTDDDAAILGPRIFAFQSDDVAMRWTNNLNA